MEKVGDIISEYLGIEFIINLKKLMVDSGRGDDVNKGWKMKDKNYKFLKFDLEYVYYKKVS